MQQIGMKYQYSYEEIVQPKNHRILFRLYLLNLDGHHDRQVAHFWNQSIIHFIETNL